MKTAIQPIRGGQTVFVVYLVWMGIGLIVTLTGTTLPDSIRTQIPTILRQFIDFCLRYGDPASIILAYVCTHWIGCQTWGVSSAYRWALPVLLVSAGVETVGALTGWPFGSYHYTENFGPRLGGVLPVVIPFCWFVLITNTLFVVRYRKDLPAWIVSLLVAAAVTLMDGLMEPFAVQIKGYWWWEALVVPPQNYVAWFALTAILVHWAAPPAAPDHRRDYRPLFVLGPILALFSLARLVHRV